MSIRPIDLGVLISKTVDVEKAQQIQQQSPNVAQQQLTAEELHKKEIKKAQVHEAPKQEGGKVNRKKDDDGGGQHPTYGQNLKQGQEQAELEEENRKIKASQSKGPSIDIRI